VLKKFVAGHERRFPEHLVATAIAAANYLLPTHSVKLLFSQFSQLMPLNESKQRTRELGDSNCTLREDRTDLKSSSNIQVARSRVLVGVMHQQQKRNLR